jgi:chaperonin GroEL
VVPGGGIALLRCQNFATFQMSEEERIGAAIVVKACHAPLRTLAENAGRSPEYIFQVVATCTLNGKKPSYGWNARDDEYGDMIEMGILDPLRVVRVALESASSVAALALITNCLVANERK